MEAKVPGTGTFNLLIMTVKESFEKHLKNVCQFSAQRQKRLSVSMQVQLRQCEFVIFLLDRYALDSTSPIERTIR